MEQIYRSGISRNKIIYLVNCDEIRLIRTLNKAKIKGLSDILFFQIVNRMDINILFTSDIYLGKDFGKDEKLIYYKNSVMNNRLNLMLDYCVGSERFLKEFINIKKDKKDRVIYRQDELYNYFLKENKKKKERNFFLMDANDTNKTKEITTQINMFDNEKDLINRNKLIKHYNKNSTYLFEMLKNVKSVNY